MTRARHAASAHRIPAIFFAALCLALLCASLAPAEMLPPPQTYALRFLRNWSAAIAPNEAPLVLGSEFTMEVWVYLDELKDGMIMGRIRDEWPNFDYALQFGNDGQVEFIQTTGHPDTYTAVAAPFLPGIQTWTHVAATLDSGTMRLFINGEEVANRTSPGEPDQNPAVRFALGTGIRTDGQAYSAVSGVLAQARIWNQALTAQEIKANAGEYLTGNEAGLLACWPLDDSSGQTARDIGPNALHLTLGTTPARDDNDPKWAGMVFLSNDPYYTMEVIKVPVEWIDNGVLIDFDSDGDLDAVIHEGDHTQLPTPLFAYRNDGQGHLTEATGDAFGGQEMLVGPLNNTNGYGVADFNGDGLVDLYLGNSGVDAPPFSGGQNRILIQTSEGHLRDETGSRLPSELAFTHDLNVGDIDGDGDIDIFNANVSSVHHNFYINNGNGFFVAETERLSLTVHETGRLMTCQLLDVDKDGDLDLIVDSLDQGRLFLFLNDGAGYFDVGDETAISVQRPGSGWSVPNMDVADFDNDGWSDLLLWGGSPHEYELQLYFNNEGNGTFRYAVDHIPQSDSAGEFFIPADLNNDGWLDFSTGGVTPFRVYRNKGHAYFSNVSGILPFLRPYSGNPLPGDLDNDGDIDLLMITESDELLILRNERPLDVNMLPQPAITEFSPVTGSVGTVVTITGTALTGISDVKMNGFSIGFSVDSDSQVTITIPQGASSGIIRMEGPNGILSTPISFTITGPSVRGFSPTTGAPNTAVAITGSNLIGTTAVEFSGISTTFTVDSGSQITAVVPEGARTGPIRITTPDGTEESIARFSVRVPPPDQQYVLRFGSEKIAIAPSHTVLKMGSQFSFEAWVYLEGYHGVIMGRTNHPVATADPRHHYVLANRQFANRYSFVQTTGEPGSFRDALDPEFPELNVWTHVAGTVDGDSLRLYINGEKVAGEATVGSPAQDISVPFAVGNGATPEDGQSEFGLNGSLRQLRVWDRALTADEIQSDMGRYLTANEPGLVAYWPLDDGPGQTIRDLGPNNIELMVGTTPGEDENDPQWVLTDAIVIPPIVNDFFPDSGAVDTTVTIVGANFAGAIGVEFNGIGTDFTVNSNSVITAIVPPASTGRVTVKSPGGTGESRELFTVIGSAAITLSPPPQSHALHFAEEARAATIEPTDAWNLDAEFTFEAWVFVDNVFEGCRIMSLGGSDYDYSFSASSAPTGLNLSFGQYAPQSNSSAGAYLEQWKNALQRWTHIAAISKDGSLRLFVDGLLVVSAPSLELASDAPAGFSLAGSFPGVLRQVRIWNRALTGKEVRLYANQYLTGDEEGLVAFWPLDEGQGQTIRDLGPNGIALRLGHSSQIDENDPVWVMPEEVLPPPVFTDFSPDAAGVGATVTIAGENFGRISSVSFNGATADFTLDSSAQITAVVPGNAIDGPISVTTPTGTATSSKAFTLTGPQVAGFSPASGPAGALVTLTGRNLLGATDVTFNGVDAGFTVNSNEQITVIVPTGAVIGPVRVTTPEGVAATASSFVIPMAPPAQPHVLRFSTQTYATGEENPSLNPGAEFTMEAWMYMDEAQDGGVLELFCGSDTGFAYYLGIGGGDASQLFFNVNSPHFTQTPSIHFPQWDGLQRWTHVATTLKDSTIHLFVDGLEAPGTATGISTPEGPSRLQLNRFVGRLRQVRLWNRALTASELQTHAQQYLTGSEEGLIACWPLDDGEGQTIRDLGPNSIPLYLGDSANIEENDPIWLQTGGIPVLKQERLELGEVLLGLEATEEIRIRNDGAVALQIDSVRITATSDPVLSLSVSESLPLEIQAGDSSLVNVRFLAVEEGELQGELVLCASNSETPLVRLPLSSTVKAKEGVGPLALDGNVQPGDQQIRTLSDPLNKADEVAIDLVATGDAEGITGFRAAVQYDPAKLSFKAFTLQGILTGAPLTDARDGLVEISVDAADAATEASGSLGQLVFIAQERLAEDTQIQLKSCQFVKPSGAERLAVGIDGAVLTLEGVKLAGDFNGDGSVGFTDFLMFAGAFGGTNPTFDLDGDGSVGFTDFLAFAAQFGKSAKRAAKKPK